MTEKYNSPLKEAICKFKQLDTRITKDSDNPFFKSKYADLATILDAIEKDMASFGLLLSSRTELIEGVLYTRTYVMHKDSQEVMESIFPVFGSKPQEVGSSITYARRYNIQSLMNLAAEDDDGNAANKTKPIKAESAASVIRKSKEVTDKLAKAESPSKFWDDNTALINEYLNFEEPEAAMRTLLEIATKRVQAIIEASNDPAEAWGQEMLIINVIKANYPSGHDRLAAAGKQRKIELEQLAMMKQQLGEE